MDVLNFISWLKSKRQVTTVDASQTLIPLGLKDARRGDSYLPGAISVQDLAGSLTPTYTNCNIPIGDFALDSVTSGLFNIALGCNTLENLTVSNNNTAIGLYALNRTTTGSYNTAIGAEAMFWNTTGDNNIGIGLHALYNNTVGSQMLQLVIML